MSTAKFNQWLNSDGTENYKCRAWVNFNGTGTVAIRASGNVSSITDDGTGQYTVNMTNALSDTNYATNVTGDVSDAYIVGVRRASAYSTTQVHIRTYNGSVVATDTNNCSVSIFR